MDDEARRIWVVAGLNSRAWGDRLVAELDEEQDSDVLGVEVVWPSRLESGLLMGVTGKSSPSSFSRDGIDCLCLSSSSCLRCPSQADRVQSMPLTCQSSMAARIFSAASS